MRASFLWLLVAMIIGFVIGMMTNAISHPADNGYNSGICMDILTNEPYYCSDPYGDNKQLPDATRCLYSPYINKIICIIVLDGYIYETAKTYT